MDFLATPFGWILWFIYKNINNYFIAIFLFTIVINLVTLPFGLMSQKAQARKAKLAPKLSRLQKKYQGNPQQLQQMQAKLYEREGVSQTEGCATSIIRIVILLGVIGVIYSPLSHIVRIPKEVINASKTAITLKEGVADENKYTADKMKSYAELKIINAVSKGENQADILNELRVLELSNNEALKGKTPEYYVEEINKIREDFMVGGRSLLENPTEKIFPPTWSILLLIPFLSYGASLLSSILTNKISGMQAQQEGVPGQGCMKVSTVVVMPLFSLVIAFTVPSAVGVYWICSSIVGLAQTLILNKVYNLAKIKEQAEIDYLEERRQYKEDKKRLAEKRRLEQQQMALDQSTGKKTKKKSSSAKTSLENNDGLNEVEDETDDVEFYDVNDDDISQRDTDFNYGTDDEADEE